MINAIQVLRYHLLELEKVSRVHSLLCFSRKYNNMQKKWLRRHFDFTIQFGDKIGKKAKK
jgi:hypothetical protein